MNKKIFFGVLLSIFFTGCLFAAAQDAIPDPFEWPVSNKPNSAEYRFKFDIPVSTPDEFIVFLKAHQYEGDGIGSKPAADRLVPSHAFFRPHLSKADLDKMRIDLDRFKDRIEIYDVKDSKLLNTRVYILKLTSADFPGDPQGILRSNHFGFLIMMSDRGYVSVRHNFGI